MPVDLSVIVAVVPVIFVSELPDKSMFASLVLASRGHPFAVWLGAASAFLVHVVIATTIGVGLFALLPHRAVETVVALLFAGAAAVAFVEAGREDEAELVEREARSHRQVFVAAFMVIFIAEWGDLTQVLTANMAAHYHDALSVGTAAAIGLCAVAALAVVAGQNLMQRVPVRRVRQLTGAILLVLAAVAAWAVVRG